jgi:hypothetical protein
VSGQVPDVTLDPEGAVTRTNASRPFVGAKAHPAAKLEICAYFARERSGPHAFVTATGKGGGWSGPTF